MYIYISSTATYRNTRHLILRTLVPFFVLHRLPAIYRNTRLLILQMLVQFYVLPHTHTPRTLHVCVYVRLSHATADSAWLSKQLENRSSRPRAFEAAEKGKHAYPDSGHQIKFIQDSGLQIAETTLGRNFTVSSQVLSRQIVHNIVELLPLAKNALLSPTSIWPIQNLPINVVWLIL